MDSSQINSTTVGDLLKRLDDKGFSVESQSLNNFSPYLMLKDHLQRQLNDPISAEILEKHIREENNDTGNKKVHFQKRDLNEAEEY